MSRERDIFVKTLAEQANRAAGQDSRVRVRTLAQRKDRERNLKGIMQGNIIWGTPIERGGEE